MRKMPKKQFDALVEISRQYWRTSIESGNPSTALLQAKVALAEKLEREIGVSMFAVADFVNGIVRVRGLCDDATEDEIYCALRCIGWEITDEV